jgi:hypothetical protein
MRRSTWLLAVLLLAGSAHASGSNRILLFTTDRGRVYLHGTLIPPPYNLSISFHMEGADTNWDQIYVNHYPMISPPKPPRLTGRDSLWMARERAAREACDRAHIPTGPPSLDRVRAIAAAYASLDTMVESARALSANEMAVYWRGVDGAWQITIADWKEPTKTRLSRNLVWAAYRDYIRPLSIGCAVLVAGEHIVWPTSFAELDQEIDEARRGGPGPYWCLKDEQLRHEMTSPRPLPPQ